MVISALWLAFGLILLTYVIASVIMIYHIYAFGLNKKTATVSVLAYVVGSSFLFMLIASNLIGISSSI